MFRICVISWIDSLIYIYIYIYILVFSLLLDCTDGFFGHNCTVECHCKDGRHCNRTSGQCQTPECIAGWKGLSCNEGK